MGKPPATGPSAEPSAVEAAVDAEPVPDLTLKGLSRAVTAFNVRGLTQGGMDHADHVALIRGALDGAGPRWLELGAGSGAFTLALLDVIGNEAHVVAIDRDAKALRTLEQTAASRFPANTVRAIVGDFTQPLPAELASIDGVLMANSLHFVRDKVPVLRPAIDALRPGGRFLIVEYGSDRGNPWVPWPIGFESWAKLAAEVGLRDTRRIGEVPSRFLGSIYAAVSHWDGQFSFPNPSDGPPTRPRR